MAVGPVQLIVLGFNHREFDGDHRGAGGAARELDGAVIAPSGELVRGRLH
jgi:hypothetical protein